MISLVDLFNFLYASIITRKANVESSPPDIPITHFELFRWINLLARAVACMFRISSHLLSLFFFFFGTKGYSSYVLFNYFNLFLIFTFIILSFVISKFFINDLFFILSCSSLSTSISAVVRVLSSSKRLFSFNRVPSS